MNPGCGILWLRQDLRLDDHAALLAAARHEHLLPVYIWSPAEEAEWAPGAASRWWLHDSLVSLQTELRSLGSDLIIATGPSLDVLRSLIAAHDGRGVYWHRRYEPAAVARDQTIKAALLADGVAAESFNGSLLFEPWQIKTQAGGPYLVYGPYWRACLQHSVAAPLPRPDRLPPLPAGVRTLPLAALNLKPRIAWDAGLKAAWTPGAPAAKSALARFCRDGVAGYDERRDLPATPGTSRLSPHLHWGELSPRQAWAGIKSAATPLAEAGAMTFQKELVWREFSYHLLFHYPRLPTEPLRQEFAAFPWEDDASALRAWQRGLTGYPIVDAGMRELWHTGWMHNRVRMIVASFLVKDLRIAWQRGAAWFWDTLVDADLAANTQGWQWTAGCGPDAAPYFRVFNPTLQGRKFDPAGEYVRKWVPELRGLPAKHVHDPSAAPEAVLQAAGVQLGEHYPRPIVDHGRARFAALKAFDQIKGIKAQKSASRS